MSNPVSSPGGGARWLSPRDWSLRVRLVVILLVPAVLAVILGGLRISDQAAEAAELDRVVRFAQAQGQVATLVDQLQQERFEATSFVAQGRNGDNGPLTDAIAAVDTASAATRPTVEALYDNDAGLAAAHRQSRQSLAQLPQIRTLAASSDAPPSAIISRYREVIDQLLVLDNTMLLGINTSEVNGLANALAGLADAHNEAALQLALITAATSDAEPAAGSLGGLVPSDARLSDGLSNFRASLDSGQRVTYAELLAGASNQARLRLLLGLQGREGNAPLPRTAATDALGIYGPFLTEIETADNGIRAELAATGEERRVTAANLAGLDAVLLLLALIVGAVIVAVVSRTMITSLRTLRSSVLEVAETRLPEAVRRMREGAVPDVDVEPVPITSREEVGQVARAFDAVHEQALRLAAEQAMLQSNVNSMFVNLSRRSQSLVDRQLQLIEDLESNEQDPDQLSNLFRLDHLATRMRRNSENLLVLSGTDLAKRNSAPVPVVDVLQAALSEVEQYERINVEQPPPVAIAGRAASDVQHLLAELLDNATSFSPPDTTVTMTAKRGDEGSIIVEITDRGVGMPVDDLVETNVKLNTTSGVTVTASRRMGLFVVGRLASRHGIEVHLESGESGGLTANVVLPTRLIDVGARSGRWGIPEQSSTPGPDRLPQHRPDADQRPRSSSPFTGAVPMDPWTPPGAVVQAAQRPSDTSGQPPALPTRMPREDRPATFPSGIPGPRGPEAFNGPPSTSRRPEPAPESRGPDNRPVRQPADTGISSFFTPTTPVASATPPVPAPLPPAPPARPALPTRTRPVAAPPASAPPAPALPGPRAAAAPARPEPLGAAPVAAETGGRTPIFEEVASGWFRSYRQVPINWQPAPSDAVSRADQPIPAPSWDPPPGLVGRAPGAAVRGPQHESVPELPVRRPRPETAPSVERDTFGAAAEVGPRPAEESSAFATPADAGWEQAASAAVRAPAAEEGTKGLPKRTPGARLLPGSVGVAPGPPAALPPTARDADAVRGRLGDYQRGVREGRGRVHEPDPLDDKS